MKHDTNQRLYVYDEIKNTFIDCFNNNTALSENSCEIIENGYVLPLKKELNQDGIGYFSGGVTNSEGLFLKASSYIRESLIGSLIDGYDFDKKIAKFIDNEVMFAGMISKHFGHFLMESTNRLWYWIENKQLNLDLVFLKQKRQNILPQFWEFIDLMGIPRNKIHIVEQITCFKKIHIPSVSNNLTNWYSDKILLPFQYVARKVKGGGTDKIYLSRTKFRAKTSCFGEDNIEHVFRQNGYKIIYPELLSLREQISYIKDAKEIAGVIGTAMHMELFALNPIKSIVLYRSDDPVSVQDLIHHALKADWYNISVNMNPFPISHGVGPILLGITEKFASFCDDFNFVYDKKKINYISNSNCRKFMKRYMEYYVQDSYNRILSIKNPYLAKRIKPFEKAYIPFKKRIKQFFKN